MRNLLTFNKFYSVIIVNILFILASVFSIITAIIGVKMAFSGYFFRYMAINNEFFAANFFGNMFIHNEIITAIFFIIFYVIFLPIYLRIIAENIIVYFKIYEKIKNIYKLKSKKLERKAIEG